MYHLSDDLKQAERRRRVKRDFFWMCVLFGGYSAVAGLVYVLASLRYTALITRPPSSFEGFPSLRPSVVEVLQYLHCILAIFFLSSFIRAAPLLWEKKPPDTAGQ